MGLPQPRLYWAPRPCLIDRPEDELDAFLEKHLAGTYQPQYGYGYEILSVSLAGGPRQRDRRYTVVLTLRDEPFAEQAWTRGHRSDIFSKLLTRVQWLPAMVTAVGDGRGDAFFFVVTEPSVPLPPPKHGESDAERLRPYLQIDLRGTRAWLHHQNVITPEPTDEPLPYLAELAREQTLGGRADLARAEGRKPRSVCLYDDIQGYRYAVTWSPEPSDVVHWGLQIFPEHRARCPDLEPSIAGMTKAGLRPISWTVFPEHDVAAAWFQPLDPVLTSEDLEPVPGRGPVAKPSPPVHGGPPRGTFREERVRRPFGGVLLWEDSLVEGERGYTFGAGDRALLAQRLTFEASEGRWPISLQAAGAHDASRVFTWIFAATDRREPRHFRVRHLPEHDGRGAGGRGVGHGGDPFRGFDDFMEGYLRISGGRAGQLAIARDGKLVFARAYKWGEPSYPMPEHTTVFRWASVSKTITAIGLMRMVEQGLVAPSDRILETLVKLGDNLPMGVTPAPALEGLTLAQAMRHTGGLFDPLDGVSGPQVLPELDDEHLLRLLTSATPIDVKKRGELHYENDNYYLVGRVVGTQWMDPVPTGRTAYQELMGSLLNEPWLEIGRARLPLGEVLAPDEAIPHALAPRVVGSELKSGAFDEQAYTGNHVLAGAWGGWAMAAVDMTRFIAALDWKVPLLSAPLLEQMAQPGGSREKDLTVAFGTYRTVRPKVRIDHHNGGMPGFSAVQARIHPNPSSGTVRGHVPPVGPGGPSNPGTGPGPSGPATNPNAPKSTWAVAAVINSSIPSGVTGRSFGEEDVVDLWDLIRHVPEEAWPTADLFGEADPKWKVQLKTDIDEGQP